MICAVFAGSRPAPAAQDTESARATARACRARQLARRVRVAGSPSAVRDVLPESGLRLRMSALVTAEPDSPGASAGPRESGA